jgi:hypothetical protein
VRHNEVFWDDVLVEYIAPPLTATPEAVITPTNPVTAELAAAPITPTAEAAAAPVQTGAVTYTVQAGDTLFGIALDQGVTLEELLANNPGVKAELLQLGQELIIKPGTTTAAATPDPAAAAPAPADPNAAPLDPNATAPAQVITATATVGEACVQSFFDDNGNGKRDDTEDLVPNILFALTANNQQLASYTTTGVDEPYCFPGLNNGSYTIAATALDIYAPTTPLNDTMDVNGGKSFFNVGLRRVTDGAVDVTRPAVPVTNNTAGPNWTAVAAVAGGALLLVGTVGFGASLFLRRRRL